MFRQINPNLAELYDQKEQNLFCDVTLVATADGSGIRAHRNVLHTASAYFKALLTANMKERSLEEIPLDGVSGAVLRQLIDYAYTQHIDTDASNVGDILAAADLFLLDGAVKICEQFYLRSIDATNAFHALAIAEKYRLTDLEQSARNFAHDRFLDIVEREQFLDLDVQTLAGFLASDDLHIDSEEDVFNTIAKWIETDPEDRKRHCAALMKTVRMSKIQYKFLHGRILRWSEKWDISHVFIDACKAKLHQDEQVTDTERTSYFKNIFVAGMSIGMVRLERYSIATNSWEDEQQIPGLCAAQIHCIDSCVYLFEDGRGVKVMRMQLATMQLEARKSRKRATQYYASVAAGQYVYCIGGVDERSVERYDTKNDEWVDIGMLNQMRHHSAAAVLAGKIYVVSGRETSGDLRSVERYDPKMNVWTNIAELNVARSFHRCCTIKGSIYAVGGYNLVGGSLTSIEKYDEQLNQWTIIEHGLTVPRGLFGICALGDWIYIAAGLQKGNRSTNDVQRLNVLDGRTETLSSLNHDPRYAFAALTP